jgi:tRNA pseudouridine55 synthase
VDGKRLYDLARAGKTVDVPMREVDVFDIQVLAWRSGEFPEMDLAIACGAGTYIRSIARDLGEAVGTGAVLSGLIRTASSGFGLETSLTFEQVEERMAAGTLELAAPIGAIAGLEMINLSEEWARRWCFGQKIEVESIDLLEPKADVGYRVHDPAGDFLGITKVEAVESGWRLLPQMVYKINETP